MKDKDLRKKIQKEFETPEVPFAEWAESRGISSQEELARKEVSVLVPADNVAGCGMCGGRKRAFTVGISVAAVLIALAIALFFIIRPVAQKLYSVSDVKSSESNIAEITSQNDIYLFDIDLAHNYIVSKDTLINDSDFILMYRINNCLLSVNNGDKTDAFYFSYYIRTYSNYEFLHYKNFEKLNSVADVNGKKVSYKFIKDDTSTYAYASFTVNGCEYYIESYGFGETVINEENFINLLNKILI